jgi:intein/homing endonuclease
MSTNWISNRELGEYLIENNYRDKDKGTLIYKRFDNLLSHFVRGIFDGDGCITISNSGLKYKQTTIYFSSTSNQDWKFLSEILDKINVNYKIRKNVDSLGKSSQLYINSSESIYNLCEFMYKDSIGIRLERKYNKYSYFLDYKKNYKRNNRLNEILSK